MKSLTPILELVSIVFIYNFGARRCYGCNIAIDSAPQKKKQQARLCISFYRDHKLLNTDVKMMK